MKTSMLSTAGPWDKISFYSMELWCSEEDQHREENEIKKVLLRERKGQVSASHTIVFPRRPHWTARYKESLRQRVRFSSLISWLYKAVVQLSIFSFEGLKYAMPMVLSPLTDRAVPPCLGQPLRCGRLSKQADWISKWLNQWVTHQWKHFPKFNKWHAVTDAVTVILMGTLLGLRNTEMTVNWEEKCITVCIAGQLGEDTHT